MNTSKETKSEYWQDLSRSEKVEILLKEGYLTDCKFIVGPNKKETATFPGHKVMFIMESPVLEKLFNGKFVESKHMSEVRIEEFYPKDFKNFYFMIYNSDEKSRQDLLAKLNASEIVALYSICHKYMVSSILEVCFQHIKTNIESRKWPLKSIILLFGMANLLSDKDLLTLTQKAILIQNINFDEILNDLPPEFFYKYMVLVSQKQSFAPKQLEKFKAVETYIIKNNLLQEQEGGIFDKNKLLELIVVKKMTPKEFVSGPGGSKLYSWETKYTNLAFLVNQNPNCSNNNYYNNYKSYNNY